MIMDDIDDDNESLLVRFICHSYDIVNSTVSVNKLRQLTVVKCVCSKQAEAVVSCEMCL